MSKDISKNINKTDEQGRKQGHWAEEIGAQTKPPPRRGRHSSRLADDFWLDEVRLGNVAEGPYVDGKKHGPWILRFVVGGSIEHPVRIEHAGSYEHGKKHGPWVEGGAEGSYKNGKRHGYWWSADGKHETWCNGVLVSTSPADKDQYVDGEKNQYVDGKRHGWWVEWHPNGGGEEGRYVNGKKEGHWVFRLADGRVQESHFVNGKEHGHWVLQFSNGDEQEGCFVNGNKHGQWVVRPLNGLAFAVTYRNGKKVN